MENLDLYKGDTFLEAFVKVDKDGDEFSLTDHEIKFFAYKHVEESAPIEISSDPESDYYTEDYNIKQSDTDTSIFLVFMDPDFTETLDPDLYHFRLRLYGPNDYTETFLRGTLRVFN